MKFTFVSNYINHHQKPFCDAMYAILGDDFSFVQTMPMEEERSAMGWDTDMTSLPYVTLLFENEYHGRLLIQEADFVMLGWSEREDLAQERLDSGKPTVRVSERIYREGRYKAVSPRGLISKYKEHVRYRKLPIYMLCIGAYTAGDFALIGAYPGKRLKWGYYPPLRLYSDEDFKNKKNLAKLDGEPWSIELVWAGRFIPLKHPENAIKVLSQINNIYGSQRSGAASNICFHLHMIGNGEMESQLKELAHSLEVDEYITWHGFMKPDDVRDIMETCHIHLCTSNQLEGWGAVVNEGMNSGCIEIVSDRMGAVPYLIENEVNGLTYAHDSYEEFEKQVLHAFDILICEHENRPGCLTNIAQNAYETIRDVWNADVAAKRIVKFAESLVDAYCQDKEVIVSLPEDGPLSISKVLQLNGGYEGKLGHL